ncbi:hypothetical protein OG953_14590 [Streptomyces sp. NBC_00057]
MTLGSPERDCAVPQVAESWQSGPGWHTVRCTSWRQDATTLIGPLLDLPPLPHIDLPRPQITTSHPNGYLWKRDHVDARLRAVLGDAPRF